MAINPMNFSGAGDLSTGVPQFGDILQQAIQNHYQNQLTKAQTSEAQQKALQNQLLNNFLSGAGGDGNNTGLGSGNALASAMLKHKLIGSTELPDEKSARELQDYANKKRLGKNIEQELGTTSFTTNQQNIQAAIKGVKPVLQQLIDMDIPHPIFGKVWDPDQSALYESIVSENVDKLMSALNLPSNEHSTKLVENMLRRQTRESESAYKKRLKGVLKRLDEKPAGRNQSYSSGSSDDLSQMSDDSLFKLYQDPNTPEAIKLAIEDIGARRRQQ